MYENQGLEIVNHNIMQARSAWVLIKLIIIIGWLERVKRYEINIEIKISIFISDSECSL